MAPIMHYVCTTHTQQNNGILTRVIVAGNHTEMVAAYMDKNTPANFVCFFTMDFKLWQTY
jgi:hypothetical protein